MKTKKEYIKAEAWMIKEYHALYNEHHETPQKIRAITPDRYLYGERLPSTSLVFFIQ
jgi:hypothetical protein